MGVSQREDNLERGEKDASKRRLRGRGFALAGKGFRMDSLEGGGKGAKENWRGWGEFCGKSHLGLLWMARKNGRASRKR